MTQTHVAKKLPRVIYTLKIRNGRNGVAYLLRPDIFPDGLRAIGLIGQDIASGNIKFRKQINGRTRIVNLTSGEYKVDRIAQRIHDRVQVV